jgi:hypothetical protein
MANTDINVGLGAPSENEPALSYVIDWKQLVDNAPSDEAINDQQTYQLFPLRTGTIVKGVYAIIEEDFAGAPNAAFAIGDANDSDGFMTSKNLQGFSETSRAHEADGAYTNTTDTTSSNGETDDVTVTLGGSKTAKIYSYDETSSTVYLEVLLSVVGGKLSSATAGRLRIIVDAIFGNLL